jgi:hypothetical protein
VAANGVGYYFWIANVDLINPAGYSNIEQNLFAF